MRRAGSCLVLLCLASSSPLHAQRGRTATRKPAPAAKPVPQTEPAEVTCPEQLGTGLKTKASFCFVLAGRDPAEGVLVSIPPHRQATLTFDLHNRHIYSEEEIRAGRGFAKYTVVIGVLSMSGDLLGRGAVQTEFRAVKDLYDRITGGAGPDGTKAVAPLGREQVSMAIPAGVDQVSLLGEVLDATTAAGREVATPGRPVAIVSNVQVTYLPAPPPRKPVTVNPANNQAPSVSLSSPASGASFTAPANITLQATASDTDGTVTRVEFHSGSTLIASDTTSPYSAVWTGATAGSYTLTARAVDDDAATLTSTAVTVTVTAAPNQLPTVSITSPIAGQSFTAPASLTIVAAASDNDGTITGVDFYVGTQVVATDSTSPYTAAWNNVAAGSYSLTAVARDNVGTTRTSGAVAVTVTATAPRPSTVVFGASADHATNVTSYIVALYRSADPVTASPVATRDLGMPAVVSGEIAVDISTLVDPLPAGSYYAVVRASGPGGTTASAPSAGFTK